MPRSGSTARSSSSRRRSRRKPTQDVVKFKVGDIEVIQMYDGIWEKAHDPGFVKNASLDEVKAALKAGGLTDAHVPIPFTVTAIRSKGKLVLFDSGTGAQVAPTAGNITKNDLWKTAGIDPAKVTTIVITHFHPDHISGLMAKDTNAPIFPNAEIHVPAAEYKFWTDPDDHGAALPSASRRYSRPGRTSSSIEGDKEVVPGVQAHQHQRPYARPHELSRGLRQQAADRAGRRHQHPGAVRQEPGLARGVRLDATLAEANRRKIFDRVVADKVTITGYHFGMPGAGTIKKDGKGYAFMPVKA